LRKGQTQGTEKEKKKGGGGGGFGTHNNGKKNKAKQAINNSSDRLDYTKLQLDCSLCTTDRKLRQPSKNSNW